jgi:N-acetylglucosamine-6-phosphate deacetylase
MSLDQASSTEGKVIKIVNARLLLDHEIVENTYLWFRDGKIVDPQELFFNDHREPDEVIDANGAIVVPGYLDVQINGAFGIDFADTSLPVEEIEMNRDIVAKGLLKYGCTSFCPTLVSSAPHVYHKVRKSLMLDNFFGSSHMAVVWETNILCKGAATSL